MAYSVHSVTKSDLAIVNDFFVMGKQRPDLGVGYPICDNIQEYFAELAIYENEIENCTFFIQDHGRLVAMFGVLFSLDEDEGYFWGPIVNEHNQDQSIADCAIHYAKGIFAERMKTFYAVVSHENTFLMDYFHHSDWRLKKSYIEMRHMVDNVENGHWESIHRLRDNEEEKRKVVRFLREVFGWGEADATVLDLLNHSNYRYLYTQTPSGQISAVMCWCKVDGTDFARIEYVAVENNHRRKGLGKSILQCGLLDIAQDISIKQIYLSVDSNSLAIPLYQSVGFEKTLCADMFELCNEHSN